MYAVVEIKGMQYKVSPDAIIQVPKTEVEEGGKVSYDRVLFLNEGKKQLVGTPVVEGAKVEATVVGHGKDEKVIVYKKKRRNRYQRKRGHRQQYTAIQIDKIVTGGNGKSTTRKTSKKQASEETAEAKDSKE